MHWLVFMSAVPASGPEEYIVVRRGDEPDVTITKADLETRNVFCFGDAMNMLWQNITQAEDRNKTTLRLELRAKGKRVFFALGFTMLGDQSRKNWPLRRPRKSVRFAVAGKECGKQKQPQEGKGGQGQPPKEVIEIM